MQTALSSSQKVKKTKFDFNLEALRGVAAFLVLWGHTIFYKVDPHFTGKGLLAYAMPGHLCVLVFFVLSGYVIGLTNSKPLTGDTIFKYIKKRIVRIYPIYFFCLTLAFLVSTTSYPLTTVLSHYFMTQGITCPIIMEINPVWSLSYEILFYLLFIPISFYRINPILAAAASFMIGLGSVFFYPAAGTGLVAAYSFGFTFWLSGLALAQNRDVTPSYSYGAMLSMLLLLLSIYQLDAPVTVFYKLFATISHLNLNVPVPFDGPQISFRDLGWLPYCLLMLSVFIGRDFKYRKYVTYFLLALPVATIFYFYKKQTLFHTQEFISSVLYGLSVLVYLFRTTLDPVVPKLIKAISKTGGISYAIYILHFPILWVFMHTEGLSGSQETFWLRVVVFFFLTISIAYLLEKKLQPHISKLFAS